MGDVRHLVLMGGWREPGMLYATQEPGKATKPILEWTGAALERAATKRLEAAMISDEPS